MRHLAFAAWAAVLFGSVAGAQPAARKEPAQYVAPERASRVEVRPPGIRLGLRKPKEFALAPLGGSEVRRLTAPDPRLKTGIHRTLPVDALRQGAWETTPEGKRLWRMAIHSPDAAGIRVEFRNFDAGAGKVWIYNGAESAGPYTGRGVFDNGYFWSDTVFAETVTLEYEPAIDLPDETALPFEIRTISHRAPRRVRALAAPLASPSKDPAASCHLDPNCYPEWKPAMSMVGQIIYEDSGDEYLCSGSLVATRDNSFKPYFLTASHCVHSEDVARSVEAYWTYQTASCGGAPPTRANSSRSKAGAHLVDYGGISQGDYSLLLLPDVPSGVTFAGWDASDPPLQTNVAGMHHPMGSWKRISFGERVSDSDVLVADQGVAPKEDFLQIYWEKGRTEPGSSGSPLFTSPGVIVGVLSYGPFSPDISACDIEPSIDGYGRFSKVYSRLSDYFENLPAAKVTPDKADLRYTVANHAAPAGQTVRLTTQSSGQLTYKLRADAPWVQLSNLAGTLSANSPATVTVTVDPSRFDRADKFATTIAILAGAAAPQYINVTATVSASQSDVTATITPATVVQSGGQWSFTIRLSENAGVATRVTAMKFNGADYSANIRDWFGTDRIEAKGAIEAPLQGQGLFPQGPQYSEFWGIDEGSGRKWYRVATVTFQ
jgi:lysyl endopeptidase